MKKTKAFTLIEMLIVMGIIVILIGVGLMVGRWALRRSNRTHHMDAARNLEIALLKYKNEEGEVPKCLNESDCEPDTEFFANVLGYTNQPAILKEYLEEYPFDGGNDATYYYATDDLGQFFVVCVSLGGIDDEQNFGYYCTGTGIGFVPEATPIPKQELEPDVGEPILGNLDDSDWKDESFAR
jgi:prepilin-type N-terminal cleavage/methylation domain-containing protein